MECNNKSASRIQEEAIAVSRNLEVLSVEYESQLSGCSGSKRKRIFQNMNMIQQGLVDADVMYSFYKYFEMIETEKQNLCSEMRRLSLENKKLQGEISNTQQNLEANKETVALFNENEKIKEYKKCYRIKSKLKEDPDSFLKKEGPVIDPLPAVDDENQSHKWAGPWYSSLLNSITLAPNHLDFIFYMRTIHKIVIQYASQGRYEVAVPLCKQAIEVLKASYGDNNPDVADKMIILALIYRDQNRNEEAVKLFIDAMTIRQRTLKMEDSCTIAVLENLALLYYKLGKHDEIEPLYKQKIEIYTKMFGRSHRNVINALNQIALISQQQGKYQEAEHYSQQVLEIVGVDHNSDDVEIDTAKEIIALCRQFHNNTRVKGEDEQKETLN